MEALLAVPYVDVAADALGYSVGLPALPALCRTRLVVPGGVVDVAILGSSHQVHVVAAGVDLRETVACLADGDTAPLARRDEPYRFTPRVERLRHGDFRRRVDALRRAVAVDPLGLVGVFPGDRHAVTAVTVRADAAGRTIAWRSVHAYPNTGEIVTTDSELQRA